MQVFRRSTSGYGLLSIIVCALALGVAACGSAGSGAASNTAAKPQNASSGTKSCVTQDVKFPKTKFVLHAGVAAGSFHRYIFKPLRAGAFEKGAPGRKKAIAKAAVAAGVIAVEVRNARNAALSDERLCKYATPLATFNAKVGDLAKKFKGGDSASTDITDTNSALDAVQKEANFGDR